MSEDFEFSEMGDRPPRTPTPAEIEASEKYFAKLARREKKIGIVFGLVTGVSFLGFIYLMGKSAGMDQVNQERSR